jgi:hypothetical protein
MDRDTRYVARALQDSVARERLGPRLSRMVERDAEVRRRLAELQGWNEHGTYLRPRYSLDIRPSAEVWNQQRRTHDRAHGAATMPADGLVRPLTFADYTELQGRIARLASGYVEDSVLVTHPDGTQEVRTVASFDSRAEDSAPATGSAPTEVAVGLAYDVRLARYGAADSYGSDA